MNGVESRILNFVITILICTLPGPHWPQWNRQNTTEIGWRINKPERESNAWFMKKSDKDFQKRIVLLLVQILVNVKVRVDEYICKEWYQRWIEYSAIIQIRKRFVLQCVSVRRFMMRPISSSTFLFLTFLLVNLSGTRGAGFMQDWIRGSSNIVKCQPWCHAGWRTLGTFSLLTKSLFVWALPKWLPPPPLAPRALVVLEFYSEMNELIMFWINICHFWWKAPLFLGGHFSYSTSINDLLNWISRILFELNNILNWILGKAILNRILNELFFGKI